jgi:hypothetical protein
MFTRRSSDTASASETDPHRAPRFWYSALGSLAAMYPVGWDGGWMFDETGRLVPEWDPGATSGRAS